MNKQLLIKLLQIDTNHNNKVSACKHGIDQDYFYIDLWKVVLQEVGLPCGLDYLFDEYYDRFTTGDSEDFEGYLNFLIKEAEYYKNEQEVQSIEKRLERLKRGVCPIHAYTLTQVDSWYEGEGERGYTIVGCALNDCVRVKYYGREDDENELLPEWQYLMWEEK